MKNIKVYCQMSVCSWFVIILVAYVFMYHLKLGGGIAVGCFTDVILRSSKNYHQEHATEPRRLPVTRSWPLGAI